jgi:hypothetical protein
LEIGRDDRIHRAEVAGGVHGLVPPQVGERRVGLALPAAVGVPLGLPMADEQHSGHGERTYPDAPEGHHGVGIDRDGHRYARNGIGGPRRR